jgi:hypothetical protein
MGSALDIGQFQKMGSLAHEGGMPQSRQTSFSLMPVFRISFRVEDRENYDVCVFNQKVHCKWKAAKEGSTYGFVDFS